MRCLIASFLFLTAGVTVAGEIELARAALRDGLWDVALRHAHSATGDVARLVILESHVGAGDWKSVSNLMTTTYKTLSGPAFDYYRAVVQGRHDEAMQLLRRGGTLEGLAEAQLYEANTLARMGKRNEAAAIWKVLVAQTNVGDRVFVQASVCLDEVAPLRRAYAVAGNVALRRSVGIRLGAALLRDAATASEGERLIRDLVKDAPDIVGATDAFLKIATTKCAVKDWNAAAGIYAEAAEIWPGVSKQGFFQLGRGFVLEKIGRHEESLTAFKEAAALLKSADDRVTAAIKQGDALMALGRKEEALAQYREILARNTTNPLVATLKDRVRVYELEAQGRSLYHAFRFSEARAVFAEIARVDRSQAERMSLFQILCFYGQGLDDEAGARADKLLQTVQDKSVRADVTLWLAKFRFNRREWKMSRELFERYAAFAADPSEAQLWSARAALADGDCKVAIQTAAKLLAGGCQNAQLSGQAMLLQGEALMELARFDEAAVVLDRVIAQEGVLPSDRVRAQLLKADALMALGADNAAYYEKALAAYRTLTFGGTRSVNDRLIMAFKIARALEKLRRTDEAIDQYYTQVVLAYRHGREHQEHFDDEARAAFSRAALWLAETYERLGKDHQSAAILTLLAESDVPAAQEARRRLERISKKGRFL